MREYFRNLWRALRGRKTGAQLLEQTLRALHNDPLYRPAENAKNMSDIYRCIGLCISAELAEYIDLAAYEAARQKTHRALADCLLATNSGTAAEVAEFLDSAVLARQAEVALSGLKLTERGLHILTVLDKINNPKSPERDAQ